MQPISANVPDTFFPAHYKRRWRTIDIPTRHRSHAGGRHIRWTGAGCRSKLAWEVKQDAAAGTRHSANSAAALVHHGQQAQSEPLELPSDVSVNHEILRGAAIGVIACLCMVLLAGGSASAFFAAVVWGSGFGALIGLLICIGSEAMPEAPVLPPASGQARIEKPKQPRRCRSASAARPDRYPRH